MIPVSQYVPPIENFCVWEGAFTSEECDQLRAQCDLQEFIDARIGDNQIDAEVRDTDIVWIKPDEKTEWIFRRMNELAALINFQKFQMDLSVFDGFQYSKYKMDGHYDWHTDTRNAPSDGMFRKLSFVVMLTDPSEYEGGDFLLCETGNNQTARRMRRNKGDLIVFYSHLPHKVEPVTSGDRFTLVTWAKGPKPR